MRKFSLLLAICLFSLLRIDAQDYVQVWADEFDRDTVNTDNWNFEIGNGSSGWGNNEKEYYTSRSENVRIENGILIITALKEDYNGYEYTSARMKTKSKAYWTYGRVEMRAKLPKGTGTWPAFWMMPQSFTYGTSLWPDNGEIDIMENVGYDPGKIYGSVHTYKNSGSNSVTKKITYSGVEDDFHVYAVEWTETDIKWYVDDYHYGTYQKLDRSWQYWPFDQNFYIILNFAVGGNWGGAAGIDTTIFPQTYQIDYIRVYQIPSTDVTQLEQDAKNATVFPNPVSNLLTVNINDNSNSGSRLKVSVYNAQGYLLYTSSQCDSQATKIDFSGFQPGIYIVRLQTEEQVKSFKVMRL